MLQLRANDLLASLGAAKQQGIPNESIALGIIFESIFGFTAGIRAVDSVSRTDFGLLAGLPFLPSVSTQYRFLQDVPVQDGLDFQTKLGKHLISLGQVTPGFPVNVDGHNIKTFSRKAMKLSFLTKEDRYGKAIRTFYTQDQESKSRSLPWPHIPEPQSHRSPASYQPKLATSLVGTSSWLPTRNGTVVNSSRNCINSTALRC